MPVDSSYRYSIRSNADCQEWVHLYSRVVVTAFKSCSDPVSLPLRSQ